MRMFEMNYLDLNLYLLLLMVVQGKVVMIEGYSCLFYIRLDEVESEETLSLFFKFINSIFLRK
jgi:hypothetical protein